MSGWECFRWFACGALAWQAIVLLVALVTNENDDAVIWSGIGLVGLVFKGIVTVIGMAIGFVASRRYVSVTRNAKDGKLYYCPSWHNLVGKLIEYDETYKWAYDINSKYKPSDGWRKCDCSFECVNIRYTPIKIAKAEGAIPVDRTVLKAAKRAWDE